ncbi:hypothetical protein [Syntrophomonas palmitatica]|uniref:hypothetical protein n=1 Tax=Syntrophomonas palmitatica TaxID=402877 RepID=UPI0012EDF1A9|nr:hypothetical protein [Syntrophomonas palmitatica]
MNKPEVETGSAQMAQEEQESVQITETDEMSSASDKEEGNLNPVVSEVKEEREAAQELENTKTAEVLQQEGMIEAPDSETEENLENRETIESEGLAEDAGTSQPLAKTQFDDEESTAEPQTSDVEENPATDKTVDEPTIKQDKTQAKKKESERTRLTGNSPKRLSQDPKRRGMNAVKIKV